MTEPSAAEIREAYARVRSPDQPHPTRAAVIACALWLQYCLALGWRTSDLDALEALWWRYHSEASGCPPVVP